MISKYVLFRQITKPREGNIKANASFINSLCKVGYTLQAKFSVLNATLGLTFVRFGVPLWLKFRVVDISLQVF